MKRDLSSPPSFNVFSPLVLRPVGQNRIRDLSRWLKRPDPGNDGRRSEF